MIPYKYFRPFPRPPPQKKKPGERIVSRRGWVSKVRVKLCVVPAQVGDECVTFFLSFFSWKEATRRIWGRGGAPAYQRATYLAASKFTVFYSSCNSYILSLGLNTATACLLTNSKLRSKCKTCSLDRIPSPSALDWADSLRSDVIVRFSAINGSYMSTRRQ